MQYLRVNSRSSHGDYYFQSKVPDSTRGVWFGKFKFKYKINKT